MGSFFHLDEIYNTQNDRIWAINREEEDKKDSAHKKKKFSIKAMTWLCVCVNKNLLNPVILEDGTIDHERCINKVLLVALKSDNKTTGHISKMVPQSHTHYLSEKWYTKQFPVFIPKNHWQSNSSDLCPLDYSLWNELAQAVHWNRVTTKVILIEEINRALEKKKF